MENRLPTSKELERMSQVDIRTVDPKEATDVKSVVIDQSQPVQERVKSYLRQTKNPYLLKVNGVVVKMSFANGSGRTLMDCLNRLVEMGSSPAEC